MPAGSYGPGKTQCLVSKASRSSGKTTKAFAGCFGVPAALAPSTPNLAEQRTTVSAGRAREFVRALQHAKDAPGPVEKMHRELRLHAGTSCCRVASPEPVPLQGFTALLRQYSCLRLFLLML